MIAGLALALSASAAAGSDRVDVNAASAGDLAELPGIGPAKAEAIVAWRGMHGGCTALDDLDDVPGIGAATVEMIRSRAYCGAAGEGVAPPASSSTGVVGARPPATAMPARVDVNRAPVEVLMTLPGFYRDRAEAVVAERERGGPFATCDDLTRVPGIGRATVAAIARICAVD